MKDPENIFVIYIIGKNVPSLRMANIYIYIYMDIYTHIYAYVYIHMYVWLYIDIHIYVYLLYKIQKYMHRISIKVYK